MDSTTITRFYHWLTRRHSTWDPPARPPGLPTRFEPEILAEDRREALAGIAGTGLPAPQQEHLALLWEEAGAASRTFDRALMAAAGLDPATCSLDQYDALLDKRTPAVNMAHGRWRQADRHLVHGLSDYLRPERFAYCPITHAGQQALVSAVGHAEVRQCTGPVWVLDELEGAGLVRSLTNADVVGWDELGPIRQGPIVEVTDMGRAVAGLLHRFTDAAPAQWGNRTGRPDYSRADPLPDHVHLQHTVAAWLKHTGHSSEGPPAGPGRRRLGLPQRPHTGWAAPGRTRGH